MSTATHIARWILLLSCLVGLAGCRKIDPPALTRTSTIDLVSYHSRYVTAQGHKEGFSLWQSTEPGKDNCHLFTLYDLGTDKLKRRTVALKTCHGGFVTAPDSGSTRADWQVWQDPVLGNCGQFIMESQGNDKYAFKTCAGRYLSAGDAGLGWEGPLQWTIVGERFELKDWEVFTVKPQ